MEELVNIIKSEPNTIVADISRSELLKILSVFIEFPKYLSDDKRAYEVLEKSVFNLYKEYNQTTKEVVDLADLEVITQAFSKYPFPSHDLCVFIERNILRMETVNPQDSQNFVMISHFYINGKYHTSEKMKLHLGELFQSALAQVMGSECFPAAMQFIGNIEPEYIRRHFRKINGICISMYTRHADTFTPKEHILIVKNMEKSGIKHKSVQKATLHYLKNSLNRLEKFKLSEIVFLLKLGNAVIPNVEKAETFYISVLTELCYRIESYKGNRLRGLFPLSGFK